MKGVSETVEFVSSGQYTLLQGHNPLPAGWRGRLVALKWLLTGFRPSVESYVSKPRELMVKCISGGGGGGSGRISGETGDRLIPKRIFVSYKCANPDCADSALAGEYLCRKCSSVM